MNANAFAIVNTNGVDIWTGDEWANPQQTSGVLDAGTWDCARSQAEAEARKVNGKVQTVGEYLGLVE